MLTFIVRRLIIMIPLLFLISILCFMIIQLPPGSYVSTYIARLETSGYKVDQTVITQLTRQYGLDKPVYTQYFLWIKNIILDANFGMSFIENRPNAEIIQERLPMTIYIALITILFTWTIAIPIAIYSATHQYSVGDYTFTLIGFAGMAIPQFLFALVLVWFLYSQTGWVVTGLFSMEFAHKDWSLAKFADLLKNLWIPILVVGTAGTAGMIRVMRATLLDELKKQYVITARAKGVSERNLLFKYPVRVAINPVISTIGWVLPQTISGMVITTIVLNLQTIGPALLNAVLTQDMYLAAAIVMLLSSLTVIGTFISDLLLVWIDPRIRYEERR